MANFRHAQPPRADDADNPLERALLVPLLPETEDFKARFGCLVSTTWGSTEVNVPMRSGFNLANNRTCGRLADDRYEVLAGLDASEAVALDPVRAGVMLKEQRAGKGR